ncbi:hypothetical protein HDU76_013733 [Blyttiomyces sp. JEL0837]|nr:hypothetical protein HDU76_013733 [Blyttiomyces sp. JEL0837]
MTGSSTNPLHLIKSLSTQLHLAYAATALLVSVGLLRRVNAAVFVSYPYGGFGLSPLIDLDYGYSGDLVIESIGSGLSFIGFFLTLVGVLLKVSESVAFVVAIGIPLVWTLDRHFPALTLQIALIPITALLLSALETVLFSFGLFIASTGILGLAGLLSYLRLLAAVLTITGGVGAFAVLGKAWAEQIGRDGRQRVEVKKE